MLPRLLSGCEFTPRVLSSYLKTALFGSHWSLSCKTQPLHEMSAVTQCRHRCCFANAGEDLGSEMPYQIRKVETCNSPCVVTSREEEEGNLDLCCTPAGRDLTCRLPSQLYLGPKSHLFKAKLPPFAARSLARVNTADVGLCPI